MKSSILFFLLLNSFLFASISENQIQAVMTNKIDKVLMILKDSNLPTEKKAFEIFSLMDTVFDYELMSRLSIGRQWGTINSEQRDTFIKLFTEKLKNSYKDKLNLYTDELVHIKGLDKPKSNRIILKTELKGKQDTYEINYKFYPKQNDNDWLIYDVDLLGVSLIQTYRHQFSDFLQNKSFDELLVFLQENK